MNVVNGLFVESVMKAAEEDRQKNMMNQVKQIFAEADPEKSGVINWLRFEACLGANFMTEFFKLINVDVSEARSVFALLDTEDSGIIDMAVFILYP